MFVDALLMRVFTRCIRNNSKTESMHERLCALWVICVTRTFWIFSHETNEMLREFKSFVGVNNTEQLSKWVMSPVLVSSPKQTEAAEAAIQAFLSKHGLNGVHVRTSNSAVIYIGWVLQSLRLRVSENGLCTYVCIQCWLDIQFWSVCLPPVAAIALLAVAYTFARFVWLLFQFYVRNSGDLC